MIVKFYYFYYTTWTNFHFKKKNVKCGKFAKLDTQLHNLEEKDSEDNGIQ